MLKNFHIDSVWLFKPDTGFFVAETIDGEKIVGTCIIPPYGMITVDAKQEPDPYNKGGFQWKCDTVRYDDIESVTLSLLASGLINGIKESKADSVFKTFGSFIWTILDAAAEGVETVEFKEKTRNPVDLLQDASGVGPKVAELMIASWKKERQVFTSAIGAIRCGLTLRQFRTIIREDHGHERFYMMLHNQEPYSVYDLVTIGVPWEKVDKIALTDWPDKPALAWDSLVRLSGAAKVVMRNFAMEGHMCVPLEVVNEQAGELIGYPSIMDSIDKPEDYGLKVFDGFVYLSDDYAIETGISQKLKEIMAAPGNPIFMDAEEIQSYAGFPLHEDQIAAIQMALTNKVSCYTGGPGVGKTTILKVLVDILEDKGVPVTLCAFMGSAARRMKIATDHEAYTLHMFFGLFRDKADRETLRKGYLIIDEMSTVTSDLLHDVVNQLYPDVSVVFIGDVDQLPPVGRGEVFVQLLESKLPNTRLTKLFRNGGAIAQACQLVNKGLMPDVEGNGDFFLITKCDDNNISNRLQKAEEYFQSQGWKNPQIITPMNNHRTAYNTMMQGLRNPNGEQIPFTQIRVGDQVVQLKNNYELEVRNGMVGKCISRTDDARVILAQMKTEDGLSSWISHDDKEILDVLFQEEEHPTTYKAKFMEQLDIGYAITAHKSQGNQFDYVIVVLPRIAPMLRLRQIVYTAMSRAKKKLAVISAPGVLKECIENEKVLRRYSNLAAFINEMELEAA